MISGVSDSPGEGGAAGEEAARDAGTCEYDPAEQCRGDRASMQFARGDRAVPEDFWRRTASHRDGPPHARQRHRRLLRATAQEIRTETVTTERSNYHAALGPTPATSGNRIRFLCGHQLFQSRSLIVVCDGMGGAKSGNVASSLAVDVFTDEVRRCQRPGMTPERGAACFDRALQLANQAVFEQAQVSDDFTAWARRSSRPTPIQDNITIINVGDSRAYHFSSHGVDLDTTGPFHRGVYSGARRADAGAGEKPPREKRNYKSRRNRAFGRGRPLSPEGAQGRLPAACSDGLSNEMADQEMLFEVAHGVRQSDCCQRLLRIAKNRGAPDNVTVAMALV